MRNLTRAVISLLLFFPFLIYSQSIHNNSQIPTSINEDGAAPDQSAILDVQSSSKGLLIPRMPFCDIEAINDPAEGLMVFDTEYNCLRIYIQNSWHCLYESRGPLGSNINLTGWSNDPISEGFDTDIDLDSEENVYVTTTTEDREIRFIKYNSKGELQWSFFELGQDLNHVEIDNADNIIVVGRIDIAPFTFNAETIDDAPRRSVFLAKLSTEGTVLNLVSLNEGRDLMQVKVDNQGSLFLAYRELNQTLNMHEFHIEKYDTNLNLTWEQVFETGPSTVASIDIDENGDVYAVGQYMDLFDSGMSIPDNMGDFNVYVIKFSGSSGSVLWNRGIESTTNIDARLVFVRNETVFLFGSDDVVGTFNDLGDTFYLKRYRASDGESVGNGLEYDKSMYVLAASFSDEANEVVFSVAERITDFNFERKLLFYSLSNFKFNEITPAFRPKATVYSEDGLRIYGNGIGVQAGNTLISGVNGEENIVFKIQRD